MTSPTLSKPALTALLPLLFPEMLHPPPLLHDAAKFVRGRVAAQDIERSTRAGVLEGRVQGSFAVNNHLYLLYRHVGVFQSHRQFLRLVAAAHHIDNRRRDFFDIYIP